MYCSSCGAALQRDLKFCNRCGFRQPASGITPESAKGLTQLTEMVKYLARAYGLVGSFGLGFLFLFARELLKRGLTGETLAVFALGFCLIFGLGGLFLLQWTRMIGWRLKPMDLDERIDKQIPGRETAEIPLMIDPAMSVTEHTTRSMEPQKR